MEQIGWTEHYFTFQPVPLYSLEFSSRLRIINILIVCLHCDKPFMCVILLKLTIILQGGHDFILFVRKFWLRDVKPTHAHQPVSDQGGIYPNFSAPRAYECSFLCSVLSKDSLTTYLCILDPWNLVGVRTFLLNN